MKSLSIAYAMKQKAKKMAKGGEVGGAETSTTGNKTKTGGSNPGGASTGGAGTVTITTGKNPPQSINISDIGGRTDSRNAGGMDPSDKDDDMMSGGGMPQEEAPEGDDVVNRAMKQYMSEGGMVANGGMDDVDQLAGGKENEFDDLAKRDGLEFSYTGDNSGDNVGNSQMSDDEKDIVARAMAAWAKKDRLPNPR